HGRRRGPPRRGSAGPFRGAPRALPSLRLPRFACTLPHERCGADRAARLIVKELDSPCMRASTRFPSPPVPAGGGSDSLPSRFPHPRARAPPPPPPHPPHPPLSHPPP